MKREPEEREIKLFETVFSVLVKSEDVSLLIDRFILTTSHPLYAEHKWIDRILRKGGKAIATPTLARERLPALVDAAADRSTSPDAWGRLAVAGIERTLWLNLNGRTALFQQRPEVRWYYVSLIELVRHLLVGRGQISLPENLLAAVLDAGSASKIDMVVDELPALLDVLESTSSLTRELRDAMARLAVRLRKLATDDYCYSGGLNAVVGGARLGRTIERVAHLATSASKAMPKGRGQPMKPLIDLAAVPVCEPKERAPRQRAHASTSRKIVPRPLSKHRKLAESVFGEVLLTKLAFEEASFGDLVVFESEARSWLVAARYVKKHREAAAQEGLWLGLSARSLGESEAKPAEIRAAIAAVGDDELYRSWLASQMKGSESFIVETKSALEEVAREVAVREGTGRPRKKRVPEEPVHVVAVNASTGILPALYGLGPFNRCPNPSIHAAVIGRWEREYGARLRHVGHDTLSLELERPPRKPVDIAWAGIANFVYCPEYPSPVAAAEHVTSATWSFWWD